MYAMNTIDLSSLLKGDIPNSIEEIGTKFNNLNVSLQQINMTTQQMSSVFKEMTLSCVETGIQLINNTLNINEMALAMMNLQESQNGFILSTNTLAEQMLALQEHANTTALSTNGLTNTFTSLLAITTNLLVSIQTASTLYGDLKTALTRVTIASTAQKVADIASATATGVSTTVKTAYTTVTQALSATLKVSTVRTLALAAAQKFSAVATGALTIAQRILNAAMRSNPFAQIVQIVLALTAVIAGACLGFDKFRAKVKSLLGIGSSKNIETAASSTQELSETNEEAIEGLDQLTEAINKQNESLAINLDTLKDTKRQLKELPTKGLPETLIPTSKKPDIVPTKELSESTPLIPDSKKPDITLLEGALKSVDVPAIQIPLKVEEGGFTGVIQEVENGLEDVQKAVIDIGKHLKDALNNVFGNFGEALGESLASGDLSGTFNAILSSIMDSLKAFGGALIAAGTAGIALKAVSWNPFLAVGAGIALIAAASAAKTALQNVAKPMANGGIVYGTTFAMVGEYPGAANNPEVVAPLNKLKQLIQPTGAMQAGQVEFVISGRTLKGVLSKMNNIDNRTR